MLKRTNTVLWPVLVVFLVVLSSTAARGVDGVVEINQARALAGGVTDTDTAGFPVAIDKSGSYRLTSDLVVSGTDHDAISVTTANVSVDLNGFAIFGPGSGTGIGIWASGDNLHVHNGTIQGFGNDGLHSDSFALVERLRVFSNGDRGIDLAGTGSIVKDSIVRSNSAEGIRIGASGLVLNNTILDNGDDGIYAGAGTTVSGNTVVGNGGRGVNAFAGCTIVGNTVRSNTGYGLDMTEDTGYANNVMSGNGDGAVHFGQEIGGNLCHASKDCNAVGMSLEP